MAQTTRAQSTEPKGWRRVAPESAAGEVGRKPVKPPEDPEGDFDSDETPPMPRPAERIGERGWERDR